MKVGVDDTAVARPKLTLPTNLHPAPIERIAVIDATG